MTANNTTSGVDDLVAAIAEAQARISPPPGAVLVAALKAGVSLIELKERLPHGEWEATLRGIGMAPRTARLYVQLAGHREMIAAAGCESIRQAQALMAEERIDKITGLKYPRVSAQQS